MIESFLTEIFTSKLSRNRLLWVRFYEDPHKIFYGALTSIEVRLFFGCIQ